MGAAELFAIFEVIALAGTWIWVMRRRRSKHGARRKASIIGFVLVSLAIALNMLLTLVMYVESSDDVGAHTYYALIGLMTLLALASLGLGIYGKGGTRVPTIVWSCIVLLTCFFTLVGIYKAIRAAESSSLTPQTAYTLRVG